MSVEKISDFAVGDIDLTAMMATLNKAYKGQAQVTLSNYDNDSAPVVKVGSVFDNNGTQYAVTGSDETPTGYSGISNSKTFYLFFDESAEAFIYSSTVPTWSDDLQGWYNGNDRALFSMYKDSGGTKYQSKSILKNRSLNKEVITLLGNSITYNNVYLAFAKYVPIVGDEMVVSGSIGNNVSSNNANLFIVNKVVRDSSTRIKIHCLSLNVNINLGSTDTNNVILNVDNSSSTFDKVNISWYNR